MVYRLLAIDIDGTLLRSNHRIDRETKESIEYVKNKGVYVTLTTGRNFASAKKIAKAVKLDDSILITHNGGFIASSVEEPVYERRFSSDQVTKIVEILEKYDCHIRIIHERQAVGNRVQQKNYLAAKMTLGIGDPLFYPVSFVETLSDHVEENPISPPKIDAHFFDEEERAAAHREFAVSMPEVDVTKSTKCNFEVVPKGVSKARGLSILGDKLGIGLDEMVAIGDSESDKKMIARVGLGVAMGNATRELKKIADWVTRSNDQRGVSYTVKEVFRKQMRVQIKSK
ncbi:Cof-type HAD-IIB family hydrolase [Pseudalkalibacillus caeni]|uniref:HAD family phosphatase n=1 Tax=Exobacillus caeni TaxID=2574798 RepID=A0A5R9FEN7_9BACL|nr:Cof-type HAD-IIB family hydrolase [Pseudalkalibacillus caeni]TLS38035.1 HAD family phosphatase [Pseudalkalibacillus caeni]